MEDLRRVTRRSLIRNGTLCTIALVSGVDNILSQKVSRAPNIVFIMADDLGYADVSCYGRPDMRTPNIDSLASKRVRFLQAYANSAVCAATRTALITGRYPYRLPLRIGRTVSPPRRWSAAGPSHFALLVEKSRPALPSSENGILECCRNSVLFKAVTTISTDSAAGLSTITPMQSPTQRIAGS
jgi:Sulfatase